MSTRAVPIPNCSEFHHFYAIKLQYINGKQGGQWIVRRLYVWFIFCVLLKTLGELEGVQFAGANQNINSLSTVLKKNYFTFYTGDKDIMKNNKELLNYIKTTGLELIEIELRDFYSL